MTLTPALLIGMASLAVGLFTTIAPLYLDAHVVSVIGGGVVTFLGGLSTLLGTQTSQTNQVVSNINDPHVTKAVVTAVSNMRGVSSVQTNTDAGAALMSVAADTEVPKVLPPKS